MKHGEWLPWLEANFPGSERTARNYMRLAENRQRVADLPTIREAVAALTKPQTVDCPGCGRMVLVERIDTFPPRLYKPGRCDRCGNKIAPEIAISTAYSIDSKRKRQLAEQAVERFWTVVGHRGWRPIVDVTVHEALHLDRALALLSDEDVAEAIDRLEKGIVETKAMVAELRRHQRRNGDGS